MDNFLNHTIIYAKRRYKSVNPSRLMFDVRTSLHKDGIDSMELNDEDTVELLLSLCSSLDIPQFTDTDLIRDSIEPGNCWRIHYYTTGNTPYVTNTQEYDKLTAVLNYCLYNLYSLSYKELGLQTPQSKPRRSLAFNNNLTLTSL